MEQKYYPIELLHWSGMTDEFIYKVKEILDIYPDYINTINSYNDNALIIACRVGNLEIVKYLIENTSIDINHSNDQGNAFLVSLKNNKNNIIEYLMNTKIDIFTLDKEQQNALYYAALHNSKFFEYLFHQGVNINQLNINNENLLFPLITNYTRHDNYHLFNFILENIDENNILLSNNKNMNILQYMDHLIEKAQTNNQTFRVQKLKKSFAPLKPILRSYC